MKKKQESGTKTDVFGGFQDTRSPHPFAHTFNLLFYYIINVVKLQALKLTVFLLIGIV